MPLPPQDRKNAPSPESADTTKWNAVAPRLKRKGFCWLIDTSLTYVELSKWIHLNSRTLLLSLSLLVSSDNLTTYTLCHMKMNVLDLSNLSWWWLTIFSIYSNDGKPQTPTSTPLLLKIIHWCTSTECDTNNLFFNQFFMNREDYVKLLDKGWNMSTQWWKIQWGRELPAQSYGDKREGGRSWASFYTHEHQQSCGGAEQLRQIWRGRRVESACTGGKREGARSWASFYTHNHQQSCWHAG